MRRSLFFVALTIGLMAVVAVSIFAVLQDRESAQAAAALIQPPAAQVKSGMGLTAVNESTGDRLYESASVTSASDHYLRGDGSGISADHDGEFCPFRDTKLRDSEL